MSPRPLPDAVRAAIETELTTARTETDDAARWRALERAHVLSQPWAWRHTTVHWRMLGLALRHRDRREALGQAVRLIVAAPGSLSGRYPEGNTGRADVGLTQPMPIPDDLAAILASTERRSG
jgi:uncharacterized protein DUF3703